MAIQELNSVEVTEVSGALLGNLGNGALNPVNGVSNLLVNLDPGNTLALTLAGVLGLLANPFILFQATDPGGIAAVGLGTLGDALGGLGL